MFKAIGETKVGDDDVTVTVQKKVFEFEVTVNDLALVDVPDAGYELGEKTTSVFFFEIAVGEDMIEKFAARGVVEDNTDVFVCFNDIV